MIGKNTRLFALLGPDLSSNRVYQMYNYIFETNGEDAAFLNISVPESKMRFTLENMASSQIESYLMTKEASSSAAAMDFFGVDGFVSKIEVKEGKLHPLIVSFAPDDSEEGLLQNAKLNFFEWFGYYPNIPADTLLTLKESAPRESVLTRSE